MKKGRKAVSSCRKVWILRHNGRPESLKILAGQNASSWSTEIEILNVKKKVSA